MIANDVQKNNSKGRMPRRSVRIAAMMILLPVLQFCPFKAVSVEPYEIRYANPLGQPWRISRYPELQGRGVRCMTEDHEGHMWFGVRDGVVRYDGLHWQDHPAPEGMFGGQVESVAARSDGSIVATTQQGLFELSGDQWRRLFPANPDVAFPVTEVIVTPKNVLWACSAWGLLKMDGDKSTLYTSSGYWDAAQRLDAFDSLVDLHTSRLPSRSFSDGTGIVLAGHTVAEMHKNSPARESGLRVGDRILAVQDETEDLHTAIHRDTGEQIELTVERYDSGRREFISFQTTAISGRHHYPAMHSVMQDSQGRIWCGTVGARILVTKDDGASWRTWQKKDGLIVGKRPAAIELANHDIMIVSTQSNGGLSTFDGSTWTRHSVTNLTDSRSVATVAQTCDGTIWMTGINQLDLQRGGKWKSYDTRVAGIPGSRHRLMVASDDALWVLGYGQYPVRIAMSPSETMSLKNLDFQCCDTDKRRWFIDSKTKRIVRHDGESAVSFGSEDGVVDDPTGIVIVPGKGMVAFGSHRKAASVSTFDGNEWTRVEFPEVAPKLTSNGFTVASDGRVWISSRRSLRIGQAGGVIVGFGKDWQHYSPPDAPAYAMTIQEMPNRRMIFASALGVVEFDGNSWTRVTDELLQDVRIHNGTTDPEGTVWLATRNRGVLCFHDGKWTAYSTEDGLLSNDVETIAVGPGQDIWASTVEGLCRFDGSRFQSAARLPGHLGSRSLRVGSGRSIWLDGNHRYLPDEQAPTAALDQRSISIDANSNAMVTWHGVDPWNRSPANELCWSYRIDGGTWSSYQQQSKLVLRDLSPGQHRFEVRSRDSDFNESKISDALTIAVLPPLWMRPWFLTVGGLILLFLSWQSVSLVRRGIAIRISNEQLEQARALLAERFAEKSAQFRAICDCSPVGIFVTEISGRVTYLNHYLERIAGGPSGDIHNKDWIDTVHPQDRCHLMKAWNHFLNSGEQVDCSGRFLHDDGTIVYFDVIADRIEVDGELVGYVGAVEDTTDRILASAELQESNSKLREALDQLKQAQDQAIKRERLSALGQMAAGVAHDVNNSLSPLLTYSELLASNDQIQGPSRRWIDLIRLGVSDTAGIVKRLDHFYRDSHNRDFLESFRMSELVMQSIELTRPHWQDAAHADGKEIEVRSESTSTSFVDGHAAQIRAVMTNLIFNSVDAISGRGTVTIDVSEDSSNVVVTVSDDGAGMTREQLDQCLEPFYTSKKSGSGLGLSECHGVVRQHGGKLQITSQPGHGSQVRILLPISATRTDAAEDSQFADTSASDANAASLPDSTPVAESTDVLYIDDDPMVRQSTVALIQAFGMSVETVSDGPSGLKRLQESDFQIVLCDQGLPGMDGIAVLNEIKRMQPELPVVMVSGWSLGDLGDGAKPDGFLEKPVGFGELQQMLQRHLRSSKAA